MARLVFSMLAVIFMTVLIESGSALRIEMNSVFEENAIIPRTVTVTCLVDDESESSGIKEIDILQIRKQGSTNWLAYISRITQNYTNKGESDLKVNGLVDHAHLRQNYINLTLLAPKPSDQGSYTCLMFFVDSNSNKLKQKKASAALDFESTRRHLEVLTRRVAVLESKLEKQSNKECECTTAMNKMEATVRSQTEKIKNLANKGASVVRNVKDLQNTVRSHTEILEDLEEDGLCNMTQTGAVTDQSILDRLTILEELSRNPTQGPHVSDNSPAVAFSASFIENRAPVENRVLVFNAVSLNQGQGYNQKNGVFLAPVSGLYAFQLNAQLTRETQGGETSIGISVNSAMVAKLMLSSDTSDHSSVSAVVNLTKGQQVKVIVLNVLTGSDVPDLSLYYDNFTLFSGFLVKQSLS